MSEGTILFLGALATLGDNDWAHPSGLPGWTRRHLVAHVAANADAIGNLVRWAASGVESPMYTSATARAEGIARGDELSPSELQSWATRSACELEAQMAGLDPKRWTSLVVTAQGRTVPASQTPWMRSREVAVHSVDLATGVSFADLPDDFLSALHADIQSKRGQIFDLVGDAAEVVAYLAGRPSRGVTTRLGTSPPPLGPWL